MDMTNIDILDNYVNNSLSEILENTAADEGWDTSARSNQPTPAAAFSDEQLDTLMNQIGLSVQRQGGL